MRVFVTGATGVVGCRLVPLPKAAESSGWVPKHPSVRAGWPEAVAAIDRKNGRSAAA